MILLASRSPQRRALLNSIGVEHRVVASAYPEDDLPGLTPSQLVAAHARAKADDVAERIQLPIGGAVLAADTAVVLGEVVLGKPTDLDDAARMLRSLSGRTHTVLTAVHLRSEAGVQERVEATDVTFRPISAALLEWYLGRGEWHGRAGAYAVQGSGAALVTQIAGDFTTVVGLPLGALAEMLDAVGLAPWC